ncbi:hypothetical protein HA402_011016 [Bradysia odoriphaga]|nr:hypothetical protein HA402_011016 [Bradysia odoriphaga]
MYVEPWHADIFDFLNLKKNTAEEKKRARDLFYALWIPDLFMKRVEANEDWSLMCPQLCPGLFDVWGEEFEKLYTKYESEGRASRVVKAQALWFAIIESQTDHTKLKEVTKTVTKNLNKIIDVNYYSVPEAKRSNMRHRPIGIGDQGLADAFILMKYPYESEKAQLLNQQIFETIYYGALEASCELAEEYGVYETYAGCPVSKGILQYDMWYKTPTDLWDWTELKKKIAQHGVRNSLLVAPMPTASTAQILGNNESFEPYTSNIYNRRVLSGEFQVVNHHLIKDLSELGLWNDDMKNLIIAHNGSIQAIDVIPSEIRELYKTVWEISVKTSMKMAADRGAFIDQSQSFNIHVAEPNYGKLTSIHFYGWKLGLKTGMYYLRTKPAAAPIQFTVDKSRLTANLKVNPVDKENVDVNSLNRRMTDMICSLQNKDECISCGS